uniref:Large ribosomal subunit protein uL4c n=1 Tax=Leptosiphonia brodiei TaxID=2608611 RepID=A0A1Z1MAF2_9FLOR|nr:ribosomal protein L4 [Leptosiphonia brodiei]ARW62939.1 ribosomal protein L4 [Leptosiphonia brodiei]
MSNTKILEYKIINGTEDKELVTLKISDDTSKQMYLIHKALKQQLTNNRVRNASTKTRSEVRGGGKKPWKQKGTGRARAGSNRSPLWKGGGIIFGPKTKTYKSKINKKEKRLAINTLISNKFKQTIIVSNLLKNIEQPSTKQAIREIEQLGIKINKKQKILIAVDKQDKNLYLSFRNLKNVKIIEINSINILSLLKADTILITHTALKQFNYLI